MAKKRKHRLGISEKAKEMVSAAGRSASLMCRSGFYFGGPEEDLKACWKSSGEFEDLTIAEERITLKFLEKVHDLLESDCRSKKNANACIAGVRFFGDAFIRIGELQKVNFKEGISGKKKRRR